MPPRRSIPAPAPPPRGGLDGLDDVLVAGAPAKVALERLTDLLLARRGVLVQEADDRHDHPGRTEAALQSVLLVERLLNRMELTVSGETLDRGDLGTVGLDTENGARLDRLAVDHDRARAAGRRVAADIRPGQAQAVSQNIDEELARLEGALAASPGD